MVRSVIFLLFGAAMALARAADPPLAGRWVTFDSDTGKKQSVVEIAVKGDEARGRIVELFLQPGEDPDPVCRDCPGEAKGKKIRGLEILSLRSEEGGARWRGTVLDPDEGRVYKGVVRISPDGKRLELRGYIGFEIFGRSETWARD